MDRSPPAYTVDANGKPLHSWRTLILPFVNELELYKQIDLSKPWNDPVNAAVFQKRPYLYRCPSSRLLGDKTTYMAIIAPNSAFPGHKTRALDEITDGSSNTVSIFEVAPDEAVPWMSPVDATQQQFLDVGPSSKVAHSGGMHALLCDGSVKFLSANMPPETRRALVSVDGGEKVGDW